MFDNVHYSTSEVRNVSVYCICTVAVLLLGKLTLYRAFEAAVQTIICHVKSQDFKTKV